MWIELDPVRGREQSGRRPALVVASDLYLEQANTLMVIVPATTTDRGWPNHIRLFRIQGVVGVGASVAG